MTKNFKISIGTEVCYTTLRALELWFIYSIKKAKMFVKNILHLKLVQVKHSVFFKLNLSQKK